MNLQLTWMGHACWLLNVGPYSVLIDPFLDDNPAAPVKSQDVRADYILCSHGHFDHVGDARSIAQRCGSTIISNYEICEWFSKQGVEKTIGMNLGGGINLPFGRVKLTLAFHSSQLPDGSYGGNPAGFLVSIPGGQNIYFACDTALFSDMKLIGDTGIDVAVLPIGDLFTMGPEDSLLAIKLLRPAKVIPSHVNTFPQIAQDVDAWAREVQAQTEAIPVVLQPGESYLF